MNFNDNDGDSGHYLLGQNSIPAIFNYRQSYTNALRAGANTGSDFPVSLASENTSRKPFVAAWSLNEAVLAVRRRFQHQLGVNTLPCSNNLGHSLPAEGGLVALGASVGAAVVAQLSARVKITAMIEPDGIFENMFSSKYQFDRFVDSSE